MHSILTQERLTQTRFVPADIPPAESANERPASPRRKRDSLKYSTFNVKKGFTSVFNCVFLYLRLERDKYDLPRIDCGFQNRR